MFKHSERRQLPYTPRQLFDLVADVEKYPQFMDAFVSMRIRHRHGDILAVDQVVRYAGLRLAFTTRAVLDPPRRITISTADFPFRSFDQHWTFTPTDAGGTLVQYDIAVELRFSMLRRLMRVVFNERRIAQTTIDAFCRRAHQIYGGGTPTAAGR